jgi:hypothetical protein
MQTGLLARCVDSWRTAIGDTMTDHACRQTITALASGRILEAPPLGACTIGELEAALPGLDAAEDIVGTLGRDGSQVCWRAVREGIAGHVLRVWHDGDDVLVIELERPKPAGGWPALRDQLGAPSQKVGVFREIVKVEEGLWFYSARGVAAQTSHAGERLDRVMVFPPTTAGDFIAHLAMSLVPPRDQPRD